MSLFTVRHLLNESWKLFKEHAYFLIASIFTIILLVGCFDVLSNIYKTSAPLGSMLFGLMGSMVHLLAMIGLITVVLKIINHETPQYNDFLKNTYLFLDYILAGIYMSIPFVLVLALLVFVFLITRSLTIMYGAGALLAIAWITFTLRLMFYGFLIVDEKRKPFAALKESYRITKGSTFKLFLLVLVGVLINIFGAMAFGLGLVVTLPMTLLMIAQAYKILRANTPRIDVLEGVVV